MYSLLLRLRTVNLPILLDNIAEIEMARQLKNLDFIKVAIPPPSKGRNDYGTQAPALVVAITPRGRELTAEKQVTRRQYGQCS